MRIKNTRKGVTALLSDRHSSEIEIHKTKHLRRSRAALALAMAMLSMRSVDAIDYTWDGLNGVTQSSDWNTSGNWLGGVVPTLGGTFSADRLLIANSTTGAGAIYNPGTGVTTTFGSGRGLIVGQAGVGAGSLSITSGTLRINGNQNPIMANANNATLLINGGTLDVTGNTTAFAQVFNGTAGVTSTFTISSGTFLGNRFDLFLNNVNGNFATTTLNLNGGIFAVNDIVRSATTGTGTSTINLNGGTLQARASSTSFLSSLYNTNVNVQAGGGIIDNQANDITIGAIIQNGVIGAGGITKTGSGTLTLSGANTFTGGITLANGGIRVATSDTALGTGTLSVTTTTANASRSSLLATSSGGGARILANNVVITNNGTGTTTLSLDGGFATLTLTGVVSGNGRVETVSSGTVRLTGNNTYTGATVLSGSGTLVLSGATATSGISVGANSTLALRQITLNSGQNITGTGNVSKDLSTFGSSTINGNNNTYSGSTTVNIDRFTVGASGVINGTSGISVLGQWDANFNNLGSVTTSGNITVAGTATATSGGTGGGVTTNSSTFRNAGSVNAANIVLNSSSGTATEVTANRGGTYTQTTGSTTLTGALTLSPNGGTGAAGSLGNDAAFNLSGGTFNTPSIVLNAGTVNITGGTLNVGSGGISGTNTNTQFNLGNATLASSAAFNSNINLTGYSGSSINTTAGDIGLSGSLTGSGNLSKTGSGLVTLSGTNSYSGTTTVTGGTLQLGNGGASGTLATSSAISVGTGATFSVNQSDLVTQGVDFSGVGISGDGGFTQAGTGTTVLSANNTYTGATSITGGTLQLGNGGASGSLAAAGTINVGAGATFSVNQSDTVIQGTDFSSSGISGAGGFTQAGTGTTVLTANNTYSGATNIVAGTLVVDGEIGGGDVTVFSGGTLRGIGVIGGDTEIQSGGFLNPGNSPGTLGTVS